ncbi:MAG: hypothetical protein L6Q76_06540, partial [Polyangiaceae bacterium]|nr:hypothetical protein [Polyangiaceae bacterium]
MRKDRAPAQAAPVEGHCGGASSRPSLAGTSIANPHSILFFVRLGGRGVVMLNAEERKVLIA